MIALEWSDVCQPAVLATVTISGVVNEREVEVIARTPRVEDLYSAAASASEYFGGSVNARRPQGTSLDKALASASTALGKVCSGAAA